MKTAIQELFDYFDEVGLKLTDNTKQKYLDTEKQQIIDAYNSSSWETDKDIEGHHYYDEKFKGKNPLM